MSEPTRLVVGRVRGVHGLRGLVRVEVLTDRPGDRFRPGAVLHPEGSARGLTITSAAPVVDGPGWRLGFQEVRDRAAAEPLRDVYLEVEVDREAELAPEAAYWHEVIGAEVRGTADQLLGRVADVYRAGETEVYTVRDGPAGEFDLAAVRDVIKVFDPRGGRIVVDEAVLDLDAPPPERPAPTPRRRRWSRHGKGARGDDAAPSGEPGGETTG